MESLAKCQSAYSRLMTIPIYLALVFRSHLGTSSGVPARPPSSSPWIVPSLPSTHRASLPHLSAHNECLSTKILASSLLSLLTVTTNTGNGANNELFTRYRLSPFHTQHISKCPRCVHCAIDQGAPGLHFAWPDHHTIDESFIQDDKLKIRVATSW